MALAVERLLGLDGAAPAAPGLYFAERLIDADHAVERFKAFGARIAQAS